MRVLVAEDVDDLATAIAAGLRRDGIAVGVALDGTAALYQLAVMSQAAGPRRRCRWGSGFVSAEELLERVWDEAADPFTTASSRP